MFFRIFEQIALFFRNLVFFQNLFTLLSAILIMLISFFLSSLFVSKFLAFFEKNFLYPPNLEKQENWREAKDNFKIISTILKKSPILKKTLLSYKKLAFQKEGLSLYELKELNELLNFSLPEKKEPEKKEEKKRKIERGERKRQYETQRKFSPSITASFELEVTSLIYSSSRFLRSLILKLKNISSGEYYLKEGDVLFFKKKGIKIIVEKIQKEGAKILVVKFRGKNFSKKEYFLKPGEKQEVRI